MKRLLISDDKTVVKFIHPDDSETAIKTVSSCDTQITEDGTFKVNETDRNKYSIFISDSAGCYMKCKFCYLTLKEMKYKKINALNLVDNIEDALKERIFAQVDGDLPQIQNKYVKLCWMGMGDAFNHTDRVVAVTGYLMDHIIKNKLAIGLDGVDISTVIPNVKNIEESLNELKSLEHILEDYPLNPHNDVLVHRNSEFSNTETTYPNRSRFRLFYSLHSAIQETRDELIPNAMEIDNAIPALLDYSENNKHNVIFHHMFIDGFNDSEKEVEALLNLIDKYKLQNHELRILRYNTCEVSTFIHESNHFRDIIKQLISVHPHVKVQVSAGSEVKAACGQFLTNN